MNEMRVSAWTDVGCVREKNEDTYCVLRLPGDRLLCAVADGMGGNEAGEIASSLAVRVLEEHFSFPAADASGDLAAVLAAAIETANRTVFATAEARPECRGMGTTLTVVLIADNWAYLGHIGDSRAYLLHHGRLAQLTDDHSLVGEMVKNGKLTELGAKNHPQKNILTRALGTEENVLCDFQRLPLASGDILLLCSDGLSNLLETEELRDAALRQTDFEALAPCLVDIARQRGGYDNITAVAIMID